MIRSAPQWPPRRSLLWALALIAGFGAVALWLLWPLPLRAGRVVVHDGDPLHQLWTMRWVQHTLFTEPARLFAANVNYPYDRALTLNQPMYTPALLTAPIYALTGNQVLAFNSAIILSFALSGIFTAILVQELTGSRWAALAAGVIYACAPVRQAHIYHLNLLGGYWTPLVLWGMHRLWSLQGGSTAQPGLARAALVAAVVGLAAAAQVLTEFYHAVYLGLAVLLFLVWQVAVRRWGLSRSGTLLLLLSGTLALLVVLPVLVNTVQAWGELGLRRPADDHDRYGARLLNYLATDQPLPLSRWLQPIGGPSAEINSAELSLYPGALAATMAVAGAALGLLRGRRDALLYLTLALAAFYLSLGPTIRVNLEAGGVPSPLYRWLYEHLPGFQGARVPARWALLLQLALAVLAGYTVAAVTDRRGRWAGPLIGALLVAVLLLDYRGTPGVGAEPIGDRPLPEIYGLLNEQPPGAVVMYPLVNADQNLPYRYEYFSTFHWRPMVNSGSSIVPPAYVDLRDALGALPAPRAVALLQALDVRYVVAHRYEMSDWDGWLARAQAEPNLRVLAEAEAGDVLLAVEPGGPPPELRAARREGSDGAPHLLLSTTGPRVLDRQHLYQRQRSAVVGLERSDGRVERVELPLPTYLLGGTWEASAPGLGADVVALRLPSAAGELRVPLEPAPATAREAAGLQLLGHTLPVSVPAGGVLPCRMYGQGRAPVAGLVLSLNIMDVQGTVLAKQDRFFDEGFAPPDRWRTEAAEPVPCDMPLPAELPPGRYSFAVGLYDPASAQFVPFADPEGNVGPYWHRPLVVSGRVE